MRRRTFMTAGLATAASTLVAARGRHDTITLGVGGDSVITRRMRHTHDSRFDAVARLLRGSDVAIANCETNFGDVGSLTPNAKGLDANLLCEGKTADDLAWMGFDLLSCANNHTLDYGTRGLTSTLQNLRRAGIRVAGAGNTLAQASSPVYADAPGGRVALIGCASTYAEGSVAADGRRDANGRPGINALRIEPMYRLPAAELEHLNRVRDLLRPSVARLHDLIPGADALLEPDAADAGTLSLLDRRFVRGEPGIEVAVRATDLGRLIDAVRSARGTASIVCVMLHDHGIYGPHTFVQKLAHQCIDAGADCFLVSGSHVFGAVEVYRGKPICHGLGSLFFQYDTLARQPTEVFAAYGLDPLTAESSSLADTLLTRFFDGDNRFWESAVVRLKFEKSKLAEFQLHPLVLGRHGVSRDCGSPGKSNPEQAATFLARIATESERFGTRIAIAESIGSVQLA